MKKELYVRVSIVRNAIVAVLVESFLEITHLNLITKQNIFYDLVQNLKHVD